MSGISITPAFSAWIESPEPGHQDEGDDLGERRDRDLGLADADRLVEDDVAPGGVDDEPRLERRLGDAAERAAGAHRADVDAGIEVVLGEPDAVAEERARGERARRVDREDADGQAERPQVAAERREQGRLARPRAAP